MQDESIPENVCAVLRLLWIFIFTLGYSRCLYIEFVHDTQQDTLFACMEHAFDAFGSVPQEILLDNMSPMVIAHPTTGPIVWHPRFEAFAQFHGFTPKAARPYRGQTKGYGKLTVMESGLA